MDRISRPKKLTPEVIRQSRPLRNPVVQEERGESSLVLKGPAQLKGILGRLVAKTSSEPVMKQYELEEVGTYVWDQIDGHSSFSAIAKRLQIEFKMNRLEAEASLSAFLKMLAERGLITLLVKEKQRG